jgi:hypothetical protein
MATQPIYQFYSCLKDYQPVIWRRFQVAGNVSLARLGYILMTMYEMQASHLFCIDYFLKEDLLDYLREKNLPTEDMRWNRPEVIHYEVLTEESLPDTETERTMDATAMTLRRLSNTPGLRLCMQYDYGDGWEVELRLEQVFQDDALPGKLLPRVLEGEGFGIIEDCGGVSGLERLAKAFQKKKGREYTEYSEWLGVKELDLSAFDIDDMNYRLKKVPRIYRDAYELGLQPTKQSLALLERKYLK